MPTLSFQQFVKNLPTESKLVFFGSLISAISVILPWYSDKDVFNTGDQFSGITGPLYLVGVIILALSVVTFLSYISSEVKGRLQKLSLHLPQQYFLAGAIDMFLLVLTTSVYLHPKFGVNIMIKDIRFGMILAFIGTGMVIAGAFLQDRKRSVSFDDLDARISPLVDMQRPHHPLPPSSSMESKEPSRSEETHSSQPLHPDM